MVKETKYYDLLEVSPSATPGDIKKAFRKAAMKWHPDKQSDPAARERAGEMFKDISRAHEILSCPEKRARYDRLGEKGVTDSGHPGADEDGGGLGSFFSQMFTGRAPGRSKPPVIGVKLEVTLEDIYSGKTATVTFPRQMTCSGCSGKGGDGSTTCNPCNGRGSVTILNQLGPGMVQQIRQPCSKCRGQGNICRNVCKKCNGNRIMNEERTETVVIERSMEDQEQIILENKGHTLPSGESTESGDVVVVLAVAPHSRFTRKGHNLHYRADLPLVKALCGGKLVVEHLDGHQIVIELDEVIAPSQTYYINGEGMHHSGERGDLIINFNVIFPERLDQPTKDALGAQLGAVSDVLPELNENHYFTKVRPYLGGNDSQGRKRENGDEDDDEGPGGGFPGGIPRGGVQCQQQ